MDTLHSASLLRHLYHEMPADEHEAFYEMLSQNKAAKEELSDLQAGMHLLSRISFAPDQHVADRIMAYAHA